MSEANIYIGIEPKCGYIGITIKQNIICRGWKFSFKEDKLENEEWRKVENYPGLQTKLEVNNMGRIKTKRVTTYGNYRENYYNFSVKINDKNVEKKVHEFICWVFNGIKPNWSTSVNHIDNNTINNKPNNLEWSNAKKQGEHRTLMNQFMKISII